MKPDSTPLTPWLLPWQQAWKAGSESIEEAEQQYRSFVERAQKIQNEAASYCDESWRHYLQGLQRLGRCTAGEEALAVQGDLVREAVDRFWDESRKLGEMWSTFASTAQPNASKSQQASEH